jgi:predicted nucleotidyltransferase
MFSNKDVDDILNKLTLESRKKTFVKDNLIFLVLSGSRAYGTFTPESDYDFRGVCIPPLDYYLTTKEFEQIEDKTNDITIYGITKFISLAKGMNPNIVELLFADKDTILFKHPLMDKILKNRNLFLSKQANVTFSGYARAQLHRMKGHKKWLDNPLVEPERNKYGLPDHPIVNHEKVKALMTLGADALKALMKEDLFENVKKEVEFNRDLDEYRRYRDWKKNRNEKRAALEAKMNFDGKFAMHLIRLLRMGKEIAVEKTIHTKRPDVEFLMKIRNGEIRYEEILELAEKESQELNDLFEKSDLPDKIDCDKVDELLFEILAEFFTPFFAPCC